MRLRLLVAALLIVASPVGAYEFEIATRAYAQGYQLRWLRFSEPDRLLNRRRFTQSLDLQIWNLLAPRRLPGKPPGRAPFDLYFTTSLRLDHDFGDFTQGDTHFVNQGVPQTLGALDAIPELEASNFALDVLWAYVGGRDLFGAVDFQLGRQLTVDTLDWHAFDGLSVTVRAPFHLAFEAHGGLLVRDASPLGSSALDPDGTAVACVTLGEGDFLNLRECDQRREPTPTFGFALATHGLRTFSARVAYRRSVSPTVDSVYPVGLDLPSWGVNEERLAASVRASLLGGGIVPWGAVRWSFLLARIDEARAGVRLAWRDVALTPEAVYSFPSFDGDSIFNVFSSEPYSEERLTAEGRRGALDGYLRVFGRRFQNSDYDRTRPDETVDTSVWAYGLDAGAGWRRGDVRARLDLRLEDGRGGLRVGGDASGRLRAARRVSIDGRLTLVRFEDDLLPTEGTRFGAQGGATFELAPEIALHLLAEENVDSFLAGQLRVVGVLDMAFVPEL